MNLQSLDWHTTLINIGMIAFAVILIIVVVRLLAKPIKALLKFLLHAAVGIALLYAVNFIGGRYFGFVVEPNTLHLIVAGIGGVPGVVLLVLYQLLF